MFAHFLRFRNLARYRQIISVLARHGFGSALEAIRVDRWWPAGSSRRFCSPFG